MVRKSNRKNISKIEKMKVKMKKKEKEKEKMTIMIMMMIINIYLNSNIVTLATAATSVAVLAELKYCISISRAFRRQNFLCPSSSSSSSSYFLLSKQILKRFALLSYRSSIISLSPHASFLFRKKIRMFYNRIANN